MMAGGWSSNHSTAAAQVRSLARRIGDRRDVVEAEAFGNLHLRLRHHAMIA